MSDSVPCDRGSPVTPAHQREVVRHRYEDECLCTLDDLIDGVYISGAIFRAEEFRRGLQKGYITQTSLQITKKIEDLKVVGQKVV